MVFVRVDRTGCLGWWVVELDMDCGRLTVHYGAMAEGYDFGELDELQPAYAASWGGSTW